MILNLIPQHSNAVGIDAPLRLAHHNFYVPAPTVCTNESVLEQTVLRGQVNRLTVHELVLHAFNLMMRRRRRREIAIQKGKRKRPTLHCRFQRLYTSLRILSTVASWMANVVSFGQRESRKLWCASRKGASIPTAFECCGISFLPSVSSPKSWEGYSRPYETTVR